MGFRFRQDPSRAATIRPLESADHLAQRVRALIEDDRQQTVVAACQHDETEGVDQVMLQALDAIAIELHRIMKENERTVAALGDVADELHQMIEGDVPHSL